MVSWGARDLLEDVDITSDSVSVFDCRSDWQPPASTNQITIFRAGYCSLYTTDTDTEWVISI